MTAPEPSVFERVVAEALHALYGGKIGYCYHEAIVYYPDGSEGPYARCIADAPRILHALATSDDVREALVKVLHEPLPMRNLSHKTADAILAALRPEAS